MTAHEAKMSLRENRSGAYTKVREQRKRSEKAFADMCSHKVSRLYWLIKSEPSTWSWSDQVKAGAKGTEWSGVRNHLAKKNLMAMRVGDLALFYHSNDGKEMVGVVEIIREHFPDTTAEKHDPWVSVQVRAVHALPKPVSLAQVKATPALSKMSLVTSARLSVQPVTKPEWRIIEDIAAF